MDFRLIDYCGEFYDAPPAARKGKFIEALSEDCRYIVMAPMEMCAFHANIARRFFASIGVAGSYNHKRDHWKTAHPGWAIAGGGYWEANDSEMTLVLRGESMAYGRFIEKGLLEEMRSAMPGYKVTVRR